MALRAKLGLLLLAPHSLRSGSARWAARRQPPAAHSTSRRALHLRLAAGTAAACMAAPLLIARQEEAAEWEDRLAWRGAEEAALATLSIDEDSPCPDSFDATAVHYLAESLSVARSNLSSVLRAVSDHSSALFSLRPTGTPRDPHNAALSPLSLPLERRRDTSGDADDVLSGGSERGGGGGPIRSTKLIPVDAIVTISPPPSPGFVACSQLLGMNISVWLLWKVVPDTLMTEWFTSSAVTLLRSPLKGLITSFTCTLSHREVWHLGMNMLGLMSFGPNLIDGRSSPRTPKMSVREFFTFYAGVGMLSSLASSMLNVYLRVPIPSLGASGALFGYLGYFTMSYPDARMTVMFVIPLSGSDTLLALTAMNVYLTGKAIYSARRGRPGPMFDGTAHLAGTALGVAWYYYNSARERRRRPGSGELAPRASRTNSLSAARQRPDSTAV